MVVPSTSASKFYKPLRRVRYRRNDVGLDIEEELDALNFIDYEEEDENVFPQNKEQETAPATSHSEGLCMEPVIVDGAGEPSHVEFSNAVNLNRQLTVKPVLSRGVMLSQFRVLQRQPQYYSTKDGPWRQIFRLLGRDPIASPFQRIPKPRHLVVARSGNGSLLHHRCLFYGAGCNCSFRYPSQAVRHMIHCLKGILYTCSYDECRKKNRQNFYEDPNLLITHAVNNHGCYTTNPSDHPTVQVKLPPGFLQPLSLGYNAHFVRAWNLKINGEEMSLALAMVIQSIENQVEPTVELVLVKLKGPDDHLVELFANVKGENGQVIPNEGKLSGISAENEYPTGLFTVPPAVVHAVNSDKHLVSKLKSGVFPKFSARLLKQHSTLSITTSVNGIRCCVKRESVQAEVDIGLTWNEVGISNEVQRCMDDRNCPLPAKFTRIIAPQIIAQRNVMIESLHEDASMNALISAILQVILNTRKDAMRFGQVQLCRAIIILPSISFMNKKAWDWTNRARIAGVSIYELRSVRKFLIETFKAQGAEIVLTTLSEVAALLNSPYTNDGVLWSILMDELAFIHVHYPDRYTWPCPKLTLENFKRKLEQRIVTKTAFAQAIPRDLRDDMFSCFFDLGAIHMSIGDDPLKRVMAMKEGKVYVNENDKPREVIRLVGGDAGPQGRWIVFVSRAKGQRLRELRLALNDAFGDNAVSEAITENMMRQTENFLDNFNSMRNHVLIANYSVLDICPLMNVDGIILYDVPHQLTDTARVSQIAELEDGNFKPVFGLHRPFPTRR